MFCPQQEKKIQMAYNITYHPPTMQYWVSSTGSLTIIHTWAHLALATHTKANCCISVQGLHPLEEHLKADYVTTPHESCPNSKPPPNAASKCGLLFPLFGGCTATILPGLTYPKILCVPKKEERQRENGSITWCWSSLSWAWAAEIVT